MYDRFEEENKSYNTFPKESINLSDLINKQEKLNDEKEGELVQIFKK